MNFSLAKIISFIFIIFFTSSCFHEDKKTDKNVDNKNNNLKSEIKNVDGKAFFINVDGKLFEKNGKNFVEVILINKEDQQPKIFENKLGLLPFKFRHIINYIDNKVQISSYLTPIYLSPQDDFYYSDIDRVFINEKDENCKSQLVKLRWNLKGLQHKDLYFQKPLVIDNIKSTCKNNDKFKEVYKRLIKRFNSLIDYNRSINITKKTINGSNFKFIFKNEHNFPLIEKKFNPQNKYNKFERQFELVMHFEKEMSYDEFYSLNNVENAYDLDIYKTKSGLVFPELTSTYKKSKELIKNIPVIKYDWKTNYSQKYGNQIKCFSNNLPINGINFPMNYVVDLMNENAYEQSKDKNKALKHRYLNLTAASKYKVDEFCASFSPYKINTNFRKYVTTHKTKFDKDGRIRLIPLAKIHINKVKSVSSNNYGSFDIKTHDGKSYDLMILRGEHYEEKNKFLERKAIGAELFSVTSNRYDFEFYKPIKVNDSKYVKLMKRSDDKILSGLFEEFYDETSKKKYFRSVNTPK